jgi:hypothetical protein
MRELQDDIAFLTDPNTSDADRLAYFRSPELKNKNFSLIAELIKTLPNEHLAGIEGIAALIENSQLLKNLLTAKLHHSDELSLPDQIYKVKSNDTPTSEKTNILKQNIRLFRILSDADFINDETVIKWMQEDKKNTLNENYLEFIYLPKHCITENLALEFLKIHPGKIHKLGCFDDVITDVVFDNVVETLITKAQSKDDILTQERKELFELITRTYHPFNTDDLIKIVNIGLNNPNQMTLFSDRTQLKHLIGRNVSQTLYEDRLTPEQIDAFSIFIRDTNLGENYYREIEENSKMPKFIEDAIKSINPWLFKKHLNELETHTPSGQPLIDAIVTISDNLSEMNCFNTKKEQKMIETFTSKVNKMVSMTLKASLEATLKEHKIKSTYKPDFDGML